MEEKNLEELKKQYKIFKKKYNLPEFSELNKLFDIEETDSETDFLLRKIRRTISEKIAGYLKFFEIILNPNNAPIFFFRILKKINDKDKEKINQIYKKLGNLEIELVKLDLDYSEEKESEFIKKVYNIFSHMQKDILKIIDKMLNGGKEEKKERGSYFG